jgi:hypothetical protein
LRPLLSSGECSSRHLAALRTVTLPGGGCERPFRRDSCKGNYGTEMAWSAPRGNRSLGTVDSRNSIVGNGSSTCRRIRFESIVQTEVCVCGRSFRQSTEPLRDALSLSSCGCPKVANSCDCVTKIRRSLVLSLFARMLSGAPCLREHCLSASTPRWAECRVAHCRFSKRIEGIPREYR